MDKKFKILFVDFDLKYINPTRNLLPEIISNVGDTTIYGPGYVSREVIDKGLFRFMEKTGPYDVLIATEWIVYISLFEENEEALRQWSEVHAYSFEKSLLLKAKEYYKVLKDFDGIKILSFLESDLYYFSKKYIDLINDSGAYCMGPCAESLAPVPPNSLELSCLSSASRKDFEENSKNWSNYLEKNPEKTISFGHHIGKDDIASPEPCFNSKKARWAVIGAQYTARKKARDLLIQANISNCGRMLTYIPAAARRLKFNLYNKRWTQKSLNYLQRNSIYKSKYSYTCGSFLRSAIRKFFEIPALGSLLVAQPCANFKELGFVDGINAIVCDPENIVDLHYELERNPERAAKISIEGYRMVAATHSDTARIGQFGKCLEAIHRGVFQGSRWRNGQFDIILQGVA